MIIAIVILAAIVTAMVLGGSTSFSREQRYGSMMDSDRMFIEQMIPHHQDAIDMANMGRIRATHAEIRQLSETIIRDQTREISLMREWYRAWYGTDVPVYTSAMMGRGRGMMGGGRGNSTMDLARLANATDFDKEFIEQMIPHHEMALMMVHMMQNSDHAEMRELGRSINRSQSVEVDQMRGWYNSWYGTEIPLFSMNRHIQGS